MLQRYGFRFFDLTDCSPQQEKTKQACAEAVRFVLSRPDLMQELKKIGKLPIRAIAAGPARAFPKSSWTAAANTSSWPF